MTEAAGLEAVQKALDYRFRDLELLRTALRHSSFAHERTDLESNQRLEFLGDGVIGLAVSQLLFEAHPDWQEGDLTRTLHALVDTRSLAQVARDLQLGEALQVGRTEVRSGGTAKRSILADTLEAVVGAVFLDGGLEPVRGLARRMFAALLDPAAAPVSRHPKTHLQEWSMAEHGVFPDYELVGDSGVEADPERFRVRVLLAGRPLGEGVAGTKRGAERAAAERALVGLRSDGG